MVGTQQFSLFTLDAYCLYLLFNGILRTNIGSNLTKICMTLRRNEANLADCLCEKHAKPRMAMIFFNLLTFFNFDMFTIHILKSCYDEDRINLRFK